MNLLFIIFFSFLVPATVLGAVELTIYDDGRSCPASCDSHVVFHDSLNGSKSAHAPDSKAPNFEACILNSECEICFDDDGVECLTTMYRGSGPGRDTFDLTPSFYEEWCRKGDIPSRLGMKCMELGRMASRLDGRVNCIKERGHSKCQAMMKQALEAKELDEQSYAECLRLGQEAFNNDRPSSNKRFHNCAYEFESNGGPNSNGVTWRKLLPAACREGTFVGRDGLDCCSGNTFVDAVLGIECRIFYPRL